MKRVTHYLNKLWLLPWLFAGLFFVLTLWPASSWFDVRTINVQNAYVGTSNKMLVEREIKSTFKANWVVTIRQWDGAGWVVWCNAEGKSNYRPEAQLPRDLDMHWWTSGQCHPLPEGRYKITTTWEIPAHGLFPTKVITVESNIFDVKPKAP